MHLFRLFCPLFFVIKPDRNYFNCSVFQMALRSGTVTVKVIEFLEGFSSASFSLFFLWWRIFTYWYRGQCCWLWPLWNIFYFSDFTTKLLTEESLPSLLSGLLLCRLPEKSSGSEKRMFSGEVRNSHTCSWVVVKTTFSSAFTNSRDC